MWKKFSQKSHHDAHLKKKNPCIYLTKSSNEPTVPEVKKVIR